ncbi:MULTISPECIES: DUF2620 domain-containing protein [Virgibacillus]|uniref:DUF2620 family protein n=2 Tax=Virgibacillus TaxID=84406 RepID=A0A024QEE7_9BACI|nr:MULTISPECIES: DUF2620 domain-containing protein [Virgibacillus]EQB36636.1 hypothetical protein M948_16525 [Virgibacillus sp. CM-4]MYL42470.1 DUF2620 family protein [Virgibacillus massiliensis]GGJ42163.1 hypothetical protein GCM10007111_00460 [Virgibacillus kapii]CDQ40336.1 hypothetical protein BN990_02658 [Virgibacillus massiliensis]
MKIIIGGQVEKQTIEALIKDIDPSIDTSVKSDLEAAMAMKTGQADYYFGACHTGGGGALAMAIAMIGRDKCETVSMPGKKPDASKVDEAVRNGKIAFGFTGDHTEVAVPMILSSIKNKA